METPQLFVAWNIPSNWAELYNLMRFEYFGNRIFEHNGRLIVDEAPDMEIRFLYKHTYYGRETYGNEYGLVIGDCVGVQKHRHYTHIVQIINVYMKQPDGVRYRHGSAIRISRALGKVEQNESIGKQLLQESVEQYTQEFLRPDK